VLEISNGRGFQNRKFLKGKLQSKPKIPRGVGRGSNQEILFFQGKAAAM